MPSIGRGISDAVRNHIPVWVDNQLVDVLHAEYEKKNFRIGKTVFRNQIRDPKNWARRSRMKTNSGYERSYTCKPLTNVTLTVHSPITDKSASGYVFELDNKPISGGKTQLKSTHITTALSKGDKTSTKHDPIFIKFTAEELESMRVRDKFGDGFDHLEDERSV